MKIMIEEKRGKKRKYYYTGVKDITINKLEGITYWTLKFMDPEQTDVYIPVNDYKLYEQGWTQTQLEI